MQIIHDRYLSASIQFSSPATHIFSSLSLSHFGRSSAVLSTTTLSADILFGHLQLPGGDSFGSERGYSGLGLPGLSTTPPLLSPSHLSASSSSSSSNSSPCSNSVPWTGRWSPPIVHPHVAPAALKLVMEDKQTHRHPGGHSFQAMVTPSPPLAPRASPTCASASKRTPEREDSNDGEPKRRRVMVRVACLGLGLLSPRQPNSVEHIVLTLSVHATSAAGE